MRCKTSQGLSMFIKNNSLGIQEITCELLLENKNKFKLIDVRRPDEFNAELSHIEGAQLKTLGPDLMEYLNSEDKNIQIAFICRSGGRSGNATAIAQDLGFKNVSNMIGGMLEWNRLGLPTDVSKSK
jgi:rhodanese-related sulfurtransferase